MKRMEGLQTQNTKRKTNEPFDLKSEDPITNNNHYLYHLES